MQAITDGIVLNNTELGALLQFPSSDKGKRIAGIAFEATKESVTVYATDGETAVRACCPNDGLRVTNDSRQWLVEVPFLKWIRKAMGTRDEIRLHFEGKSLNYANLTVINEDGEKVDGGALTCDHDAVIQEMNFPFDRMHGLMKLPSNDKGVPIEIQAKHVKRLGLVAEAAGGVLGIRPPRSALEPGVWSGTRMKTDWIVLIMAVQRLTDSSDEDTQMDLFGEVTETIKDPAPGSETVMAATEVPADEVPANDTARHNSPEKKTAKKTAKKAGKKPAKRASRKGAK
jgi:hypothetical protein